ncbi:MAG: TetR family transcriptional regulator [Kiloniellales bacterium]
MTRDRRRAPPRPARIVDAALVLAEERGWAGVRLREVAERFDMPLSELRRHFRDKDAVADAWLARADAAMLALPEPGFEELPTRERLFLVICRWLDALAPHRRVTGEMLAEKLYPGHPHHNLALVFWVSRTVQWIREAARLDAGGMQKRLEEIGITALFVATLAVWVRDDSPGGSRTRRFLANRLAEAERAMVWLQPKR